MKIAVPVWVLILLVVTIVALVVIIWSIKRHRDPRLRIESDAPLAELLPSLSGLTILAATGSWRGCIPFKAN